MDWLAQYRNYCARRRTKRVRMGGHHQLPAPAGRILLDNDVIGVGASEDDDRSRSRDDTALALYGISIGILPDELVIITTLQIALLAESASFVLFSEMCYCNIILVHPPATN